MGAKKYRDINQTITRSTLITNWARQSCQHTLSDMKERNKTAEAQRIFQDKTKNGKKQSFVF